MKSVTSSPEATDFFQQRLKIYRASLTPAGRRVVDFIAQNRGAALASSALELATLTGTSDATVVRVVQTLGFDGLPDLKRQLAASVDAPRTPADKMRRTLEEIGSDADDALQAVLRAHEEGLKTLRLPSSRKRVVAAVQILETAERIVIFGIGPTGSIAGYVATQLTRSGRRSFVLNATGTALADQLLDLRQGDAVLLLAYAPAYPEVMAVFGEAQRLGLPSVLVTDDLNSELARFAKAVVPVHRGETGHVALHATTLACLEALVLGLSSASKTRTTTALERLNELRSLVSRKIRL